ncbi:MAG: mechanosensitive ion channel family protein [Balneolaceae bacterium]
MTTQATEQIEDLGHRWQQWLENMPHYYTGILESAAVILVLVIARLVILRIVNRRIQDPLIRYKWRKNLAYTLSFAGFLMVGRIWFEGVGSLATFLGLLSAGIAIALRDPLVDMAGWLFLIWRKPFNVGDRIQIGESRGDVIDIRPYKFTLLEIGNWVHADQSTGRVIHIPNHRVFSESIANYTSDFDFIWNELEVPVTFESNWKKAKRILEEIADDHLEEFVKDAGLQIKKASRSYLIRYNYLTPIVYSEIRENGVMLTLRHLTDPRQRRRMDMILWEEILDRFKEEGDLAFAYQTVRIYQRPVEGGKENRTGSGPDI